MDLPQLRALITRYFNDSELRDLCFDLGIDYENLGGDNKTAKARELVGYGLRHGRLAELEAACRRLRPNAFTDGHSPATEPTPQAGGQPGSTVVNQSGGINIEHIEHLTVQGDMIGRDKLTRGGSGSSESTPSDSTDSTRPNP